MRSFRFPLWMIVLMMTVLAGSVITIEKVRILSTQLALGNDNVPSGWWALPGLFLIVALVMGAAAFAVYGVRHLLRRTGVQRLSDIEIVHHGK